jgi:very-short-patch-repair endonuclease
MARKLSAELLDDAERLLGKLRNVGLVAQELGVDPDYLSQHLRARGVITDRRNRLTPELLDRAEELLRLYGRVAAVAKTLGVGADSLSKALRARGVATDLRGIVYRESHNAKQVDRDAVVAAYLAGESSKSIHQRLGISREAVRNELKRRGIQPRSKSGAMFMRMSRTSAEDRKRLAEAAHAAARGKPQSQETREKIALTRHGRQTNCGPFEEELTDVLQAAGFTVQRQAPIGRYNVDLLVNDAVAVEVTMGGSEGTPNHRERTKHLLDRGLHAFYLGFAEVDIAVLCLPYIITDLHILCSDPAAPREYRVVRCAAHSYARLSEKNRKPALERASVRFSYFTRYRYVAGAG